MRAKTPGLLYGRRKRFSGVAEEGFEAEVHVLLDVAVEESEAGLVGGEWTWAEGQPPNSQGVD
jgi:hypothetical protein